VLLLLTDEVSSYIPHWQRKTHGSCNVMLFPATLAFLASVPATLALVEHNEVVSFMGFYNNIY
jgi:hypothetical protein